MYICDKRTKPMKDQDYWIFSISWMKALLIFNQVLTAPNEWFIYFQQKFYYSIIRPFLIESSFNVIPSFISVGCSSYLIVRWGTHLYVTFSVHLSIYLSIRLSHTISQELDIMMIIFGTHDLKWWYLQIFF